MRLDLIIKIDIYGDAHTDKKFSELLLIKY